MWNYSGGNRFLQGIPVCSCMRGTCNIDTLVMSEFVSVKYITLTTDTYYNFKKVQEDSSIRGITQVKNAATNYQNLMICKKALR